MKTQLSVAKLATLATALCILVPLAAAHEHDTYKIGNGYYVITVGSLNEPFVVDEMSGVDLRVSQVAGPGGKGATRAAGNGTPVIGLDQTLKVELAAGDKKETLALDPSDRAPGGYTAAFIPTVQTTYSYRLFGTINNNPIDLTFACVPGEVSETAEDTSQVRVSDAVIRIRKVGAFGCPAARSAVGFPEPAFSSYELSQNAQNLAAAAHTAEKQAAMAEALGIAGCITGLLGLVVAGIAWKRR